MCPQDSLSRRAEDVRLADPAVVCLVQFVTATHPPAVRLVLRLLHQDHARVCLLHLAKRAAHLLLESLDPRRRLAADYHPVEPKRELAEEHSSDSQF